MHFSFPIKLPEDTKPLQIMYALPANQFQINSQISPQITNHLQVTDYKFYFYQDRIEILMEINA